MIILFVSSDDVVEFSILYAPHREYVCTIEQGRCVEV